MKLLWASIFCMFLLGFFIANLSYAAVPVPVPPIPTITEQGAVAIPVIRSEDGRYWKSDLQCDLFLQVCLITKLEQICQPDKTNFSPSFCWSLQR